MEREEEVEVVRKALEYERECLKKDQMLNNVRSERFSSMPSAPQMRVVTKPSYPMVEAPMKYNWKIWYLMIALIMYLLYKRIIPATEYTITLVIGIWAILPFVFKKIKNSKIEAIKKSPEYIQQCRMIDWQFQNDVMIAKQEYDYNMQYYNNTVLVDYNNQKKQWQSEHDQRLSIANKERNEAYSIMRDFYEKTRIRRP